MTTVHRKAIWTARRAGGGRPLRILVVDDHEMGAQAVALALSFAGYEMQFAYNSKDAIERLVSWTPHIAVLDINMPPPDGFQLAVALRDSASTCDIYIIAHTSMAEADVRAGSPPAGFDAYCQKGAGVGALIDTISCARFGE